MTDFEKFKQVFNVTGVPYIIINMDEIIEVLFHEMPGGDPTGLLIFDLDGSFNEIQTVE